MADHLEESQQGLIKRYDQLYQKEDFFGSPSDIVRKFLAYASSGSVLDLGAGQGRNSIFLAERGFVVTAIDASEVGVQKLRDVAHAKSLPITAAVQDMREYPFSESFDVIIAQLVLSYVGSAEGVAMINTMQSHTHPGGFNIITVVTRDSDQFRYRPSAEQYFYPDAGELKTFYAGWEVLEYTHRKQPARKKLPDGSHMINTIEEMIARKPR